VVNSVIVTQERGCSKISFAIWAGVGYNPCYALAFGWRFTMFSGRGQPKEDS
jgi:hypothetical protein